GGGGASPPRSPLAAAPPLFCVSAHASSPPTTRSRNKARPYPLLGNAQTPSPIPRRLYLSRPSVFLRIARG
ncbi:hypothetical protein COCVIDRAFT_109987, partial [Bipolaris victoriae FI3]